MIEGRLNSRVWAEVRAFGFGRQCLFYLEDLVGKSLERSAVVLGDQFPDFLATAIISIRSHGTLVTRAASGKTTIPSKPVSSTRL